MAEQLAFNMDCMEAMRDMPDNAFDLAVVDPPYGINICSQSVHVEREREIEQQSAEAAHSEVRKTQIGGGLLSSPKSITLLMTKRRQMLSILLRSKE